MIQAVRSASIGRFSYYNILSVTSRQREENMDYNKRQNETRQHIDFDIIQMV